MVTLLKKDLLLNSWLSYSGFALFILIAYIGINSPYVIFLISFFAFCYSAFYADDRNHVHRFIISLPIKRNRIIQSRYLFCMLIVVFVIVLQKTFMILFAPILSENHYIYGWKDIILLACIGFLAIAIAIPILQLFRAIYAFVIFMALNSLLVYFLMDQLVVMLHMTNEIIITELDAGYVLLLEKFLPYHPYIILPIATGIIVYVSMILSIYIFKKKDC